METLRQLAPYGMDWKTGEPFAPLPTQRQILSWVHGIRHGEAAAKGTPILYIQHGVNAGGTRGVLYPMLIMLLEHPGIRILDGRKDFNDLRLSAMETFFEMIPVEAILQKDEQEHRYVIASLDKSTGQASSSTLFFRELKDTSGLGSQEFAVIVVHEAHEITEHAFRVLKQRCRQAGYPNFILMEGNPPSVGHWLAKMTDPLSPTYDPDITLMKLSSYENWPNMKPSYQTMLEAQPASWRRRYLLGETGALPDGTPVYPSFVEAVHVRETHLIPDRPVIRGWDFGLRRAACVWFQRADDGKLLFHREWLAQETPEERFIEGVKVRTAEWFGSRVCMDYGDPAARNRDPNGVSTLQRLQRAGIQLRYRVSTYGERIPLINRKLSEMVQGEPLVSVNPSCEILVEALAGGYHYPELKDHQAFGPTMDIPYKDGWFEHIANAFEYGIVNLYLGSAPVIKRFVEAKRQRERRFLSRQGAAVF